MIILATANPHKVAELREILGQAVEVRSLSEAAPGGVAPPEPTETGSTFTENATIKARAYAAALGSMCLADDSGLEVDAIQGAPGVISSHYSTDGLETGLARAERDAANNARLLRELAGLPDHRRTARFVCVMCLAAPDGTVLATTAGNFAGRIGLPGEVPRGANGFGYDPLFLVPPDYTRTSAELSSDEKNERSHRGEAARRMLERIRELKLA